MAKSIKNLGLSIVNNLKYFILITIILISSSFLEASPEEGFTVVVLPDTQFYSEKYPDIFMAQTKWIAENKKKMNIKMVIHLGDIVENWNNIDEWKNANSAFSLLETNNVPFSVVPGNHDFRWRNYENYDHYFPASRFNRKDWYGGSFNNNQNNYQLMTYDKRDYLFIGLNFCPSRKEIGWAKSILKNHPDHFAILSTHGFLSTKGKRGIVGCWVTELMWKDLIKPQKNLQIVLNGHAHGEARRMDKNDSGKPVYQLLADYQEEANGGNGFLRIMRFVPSSQKVYVETYSPHLDKYKTGEKSKFILDIDL